MNKIKVQELKSILHYFPETGKLVWADRSSNAFNGRLAGKSAGCLKSNGYVHVRINGVSYLAHRLAWLHFYGEWPHEMLDHIDCNKSNNRISNLRLATRSQNAANVIPRGNYLKGVTFNRRCLKYQAQIKSLGKNNYLGLFDTEADAHSAYLTAAKLIFGKFARPA